MFLKLVIFERKHLIEKKKLKLNSKNIEKKYFR